MSNPRLNLIGERFGRLLVIASAGLNHKKSSMWECACECGNIVICKGQHLKKGATKSCGCLRIQMHFKHGLARTPFRDIWRNLLARCYNPDNKDYPNYGARGIIACNAIRQSPQTLLAILGERPAKMTVDRIDNNGGYWCGGCSECFANKWSMNLRWATRSEQGLNQRRSRKNEN